MMLLNNLAQIDPETFKGLLDTYGIVAVMLLLLVFMVFQSTSNSSKVARIEAELKKDQQKELSNMRSEQSERLQRVEDKLESTESLLDQREKAWTTERKLLTDDRDAIKVELERALKNEKRTQDKLSEVLEKVQKLENRITELERENLIARDEKTQLIRDMNYRDNTIKELKREKGDLLKQQKVTDQLLADYRQQLEDTKAERKELQHNLNEANGTILALSEQLQKLTDKTLPIPQLDDDGNLIASTATPDATTQSDSNANDSIEDTDKRKSA